MQAQILALITQADIALGGGTPKDNIALLVKLFMEDFYGRPIGAIIKAVRDGIRKSTVGHKLTYPLLCGWVYDMDEAIEQHNYNEHVRLTRG